jgi:hypothetical protein
MGESLKRYAIMETYSQQPLIDQGKDTAFMGYTQCFCAAEKTNGAKYDQVYSDPNAKDNGQVLEVPVCKQWVNDQF